MDELKKANLNLHKASIRLTKAFEKLAEHEKWERDFQEAAARKEGDNSLLLDEVERNKKHLKAAQVEVESALFSLRSCLRERDKLTSVH